MNEYTIDGRVYTTYRYHTDRITTQYISKSLRRAPQLTASLRKQITLFCGNGLLL